MRPVTILALLSLLGCQQQDTAQTRLSAGGEPTSGGGFGATNTTPTGATSTSTSSSTPGTTGTTGTAETTSTTGGTTGSAAECPDGVICVDTFPFTHSGDTSASSAREFDAYACAPDTDESGPEIVYRVTLAEEGYLALGLNDWDADVDVHLLESLDPDDCIDRGHLSAGALLEAGTYHVIIDSWVSDGTEYAGQYDLWMGHTAPQAFEVEGLDREVLSLGLHAFDAAWFTDETDSFLFTIIDFSLPSTEKRQWTIDLLDAALWYSLHVTHGEGSGSSSDARYADKFSNTEGSHQSSLGLMRTAETYEGSNGYSLRLDGLESNINDNVRDRAIVVHGADYATQDFIDSYGYLGRSWGCPAIDDTISSSLIDDVSGGSLYWTYYPDDDFLADSAYLP